MERRGLMTRGQTRNNKRKKKAKLSQTPKKDIVNDTPDANASNLDVEYSQELADTDDVEAKERARDADARAHNRSLDEI